MKFFLPALALFITGLVTDHAFAEVTALGVAQGIGTFAGLIDVVTGTVVKAAGTFLMAAAMVVFFYGLVEFIIASRKGDGPGITNGKVFMGWSLAALFVMFSVYGIIKFGQGIIFQGNDVNTITIPELNFIKGVNSNSRPGNGGLGGSRVESQSGTGGLGGGALTPSFGNSRVFGTGADCTSDRECMNGLKCIDYSCKDSASQPTTNKGGSQSGSTYSCSPGFECTLSSGGTGLCNSSGTACESNSVTPPVNDFGKDNNSGSVYYDTGSSQDPCSADDGSCGE